MVSVHDHVVVRDSRDVRVVVRDVVIVRDVRDVGNARIADVHAAEVIPTDPVRRNIRFTIAEREPPDAATATETDTYTQVASAYPCDQRRCIDGPDCHWSRHPAPISAVVDPSSVVAGRESPRRVVYPSPAPGFHPYPVSVAIRSPTRIHSRDPNCAIRGQHAPRSVVIEIFSADYIG